MEDIEKHFLFLNVKFEIYRDVMCDDYAQLMHFVCREGDCISIDILLKKGYDINEKTRYNDTPLHYACMYNKNLEIAKYLIDNGVDHTIKNNDGETPLHTFTLRGEEIIKVELEKYIEDRDSLKIKEPVDF